VHLGAYSLRLQNTGVQMANTQDGLGSTASTHRKPQRPSVHSLPARLTRRIPGDGPGIAEDCQKEH